MARIYKAEEIKKFFNSIPKSVVEKENVKQLLREKRDWKDFCNALDSNKCSLCGKSLKYVRKDKPCLHWLLRPKGADKKRILEMLSSGKYSFFQVQSYIRWLGNYEKPLANINTLEGERDPKKLFEITVKYKDISWTMNYGKSDLEGHLGSKNNFPHYHFAMRIKDLPFIDFSDRHISFTDSDLFNIFAMDSGVMQSRPKYGAGLQDLFENVDPEEIINSSTSSQSDMDNVMRFDTFIEADEGETIKGEEISEIIKKSKETGEPLAKLVRKLGYKTKTIISPGERIPEILHRTKKRKKT